MTFFVARRMKGGRLQYDSNLFLSSKNRGTKTRIQRHSNTFVLGNYIFI